MKNLLFVSLIILIPAHSFALKRVDRYNSSNVFVASSTLISGGTGCVAVAGDTCYIYDDDYNEAVTCRSGSDGNSVRYTSFYSSAPATIRRFDCTGDTFVTIDHLYISNAPGTFTADTNPSFIVTTSTGITIENNWIHDTTALGIRANNASAKAHRLTVRNNIIERLGGTSKAITALTMVSSGTLYTPGTYTAVPIIGGTGSGGTAATVVVNGAGFLTSMTVVSTGTGLGYVLNENITVNSSDVGGTGSGASYSISNFDGRQTAFQVYATSAVYEHNDLSYVNDCFVVFGDYIVVRNNVCHDSIIGDAASNEHLDFVQSFVTSFSNTTTASHLLVEGNIMHNVLGVVHSSAGEGSHFTLVNGAAPADSTNWLTRYNLAYDIASSFAIHDTNGTMTMEKHHLYNNTVIRTTLGGTNHNAITFNRPTDSSVLNNLIVDGITGGSPFSGMTTSGNVFKSSNWFSQTTGSLSWATEASTQENPILNKTPYFVQGSSLVINQSYYLTSASTNAIDMGIRLSTASGSGVGITTLVTTDSGMFQDGWAGTTPDCIAVGSVSNIACISSINHGTDTITLATPLTWNNGDPIYLYSNSDGTRVLYGNAPDIGAFEYLASGTNGVGSTIINGSSRFNGRLVIQ